MIDVNAVTEQLQVPSWNATDKINKNKMIDRNGTADVVVVVVVVDDVECKSLSFGFDCI